MSFSHLFVATLFAAVVLFGPKLLPGKHGPGIAATEWSDATGG